MMQIKTIIMTSLLLANSSAFALQALDDNSMSQTTGQDGLTIKLENFAPNAQVIWTDTNGINSSDGIDPASVGITTGTPQAGAVVFGNGTTSGNLRASNGTTTITIDTDGDNGAPTLNIGIQLPSDLTVNTGEISVVGKDASNHLINPVKILDDMKIELGGLNLNMQLGNAPQGELMKFYGTIAGGLRISNIDLIDASSGSDQYGIGIQKMTVRDAGGSSDLTFNGGGLSVSNAGLIITPSAGKQVDVLMDNVRVGDLASSSAIGSVAILGFQLGGRSLTITGH